MKTVEKLSEIRKDLDRVIKNTKSRMKNAPPGSLNISTGQKTPRYYWNTSVNGKRKKYYLGKKDAFKINSLAQKDFDRQIMRAAEIQKRCIDAFLKEYDEDALRNIYKNLSPERKKLIDADYLDDEEYARQWMAVSYEEGRFDLGTGEFYTQRGERVRSKSEKIIADALFSHGIPYRYEYPLHMDDGKTWRPDFTILVKRTRKEYILEHFGMMDDPDYLSNALGKLHVYMENGFFPGDNLLITAESSARPLSTKDLDMIIDHYLK